LDSQCNHDEVKAPLLDRIIEGLVEEQATQSKAVVWTPISVLIRTLWLSNGGDTQRADPSSQRITDHISSTTVVVQAIPTNLSAERAQGWVFIITILYLTDLGTVYSRSTTWGAISSGAEGHGVLIPIKGLIDLPIAVIILAITALF